MIIQISKKKLVLSSSNESEIYNTLHEIELIDDLKIKFKIRDLIALDQAEKVLPKELVAELLLKCSGIIRDLVIPELPEYKNAEGLCVYLLQSGNFISLISFGEFQYGLYKMYVEGIFENVKI